MTKVPLEEVLMEREKEQQQLQRTIKLRRETEKDPKRILLINQGIQVKARKTQTAKKDQKGGVGRAREQMIRGMLSHIR